MVQSRNTIVVRGGEVDAIGHQGGLTELRVGYPKLPAAGLSFRRRSVCLKVSLKTS